LLTHGILPELGLVRRVQERQLVLRALVACFGNRAGFDAQAKDDHPPCTIPAAQAELAVDSVEALADALPVALPPEPLDQSLDPGGLPDGSSSRQ